MGNWGQNTLDWLERSTPLGGYVKSTRSNIRKVFGNAPPNNDLDRFLRQDSGSNLTKQAWDSYILGVRWGLWGIKYAEQQLSGAIFYKTLNGKLEIANAKKGIENGVDAISLKNEKPKYGKSQDPIADYLIHQTSITHIWTTRSGQIVDWMTNLPVFISKPKAPQQQPRKEPVVTSHVAVARQVDRKHTSFPTTTINKKNADYDATSNTTIILSGAKIILPNVGSATKQFLNGVIKIETESLLNAINPYSNYPRLSENALQTPLVGPYQNVRERMEKHGGYEQVRKNVVEITNQQLGAKFGLNIRGKNLLSSGPSTKSNSKAIFKDDFEVFSNSYALLKYNGPGRPITRVRSDDNSKVLGIMSEKELKDKAQLMASYGYFLEASYNSDKIPISFNPKDSLGLTPDLFSRVFAKVTPEGYGHSFTLDPLDKNNLVLTSFMFGFIQGHNYTYQVGLKNIHNINDAINFMFPELIGNLKIGAGKNITTFIASKIVGLGVDLGVIMTKGAQSANLNNALLGFATYSLLNGNKIFKSAGSDEKIAILQAVLCYVINNHQAASADITGGLQMRQTGTAAGNQAYPDPIRFPKAAMYYSLLVHKKFQNNYLNGVIFVTNEHPLYGFLLNAGAPTTNIQIRENNYKGPTSPPEAFIPPNYLERIPLFNKTTHSFNVAPFSGIKFPSNNKRITTEGTEQAKKQQPSLVR
jgi:hypothetical protein